MGTNQHAYVALLRGINVGGHTIVSMAELKTCFERLGYQKVKTYINSGNVIFITDNADARALEVAIETALMHTFKHIITVVVRTRAEIAYLLDHLPTSWMGSTEQKMNIIFLRHTVDNRKILEKFHLKPEIEELHYVPGALLWSALSSDLTKSEMLRVNKMPIYKDMTVRGLTTTRKILEIMSDTQK